MRALLCRAGLAIALVVLVAVLMTGCPGKTTSSTSPVAKTGPEPAIKGPAAAATGATSAGTWKWDPASPKIDPATIPAAAPAGSMDMRPFEVKNVLVKEEADKNRWMVRFFDQVEPGKETNWSGPDKAQYFEITVPKAATGTKHEIPFDSDQWDLGKNMWMYYQSRSGTAPSGTSVNPGKGVAMYLEFTDLTKKPPAEGSDVVGTAAGKVALGSKMIDANSLSFIAGTWEAKIVK